MNGWAGKILHIDLTSGLSHEEPLNAEWASSYVGGHGLAARLGYDLIKPGLDPLSPEAPIILAAGPLVGTLTPGATKTSVLIKSVACGFIGPGAMGSSFGPNLKSAGYDAMVITGAAKKPVYLHVEDEKVTIKDAAPYWGKRDIYETTDELWAKYGTESAVLTIGTTGEKRLPIGLAIADRLTHLGKDGVGAVMGSKNLKAIVVCGTRGVAVANKARFLKVLNQYLQTLRNFPRYGEWKQYGLLSFLEQYVDTGQMMIGENWRRAMSPEEFQNFSRPLQDKHRLRAVACPGCPVGDKMIGCVPEGPYQGLETGVSTIIIITITWVSRFLMGDPTACDFAHAYKLHDMCNRAGIEEIQASGIMAWLVDLYNHGVISKQELGGIEPKYDFKTALDWVEKTVNQEGIGVTIAKGWNGAIKDIGRGSEKYAMIKKGLDFEFDPRAAFGSESFSQCVRSRGGSPPIEAMAMTMRDGEVSPDNIQKWISRRGIIPKEEQSHIFTGPPSGFHVGRYTKWIEEWYQGMNCLGLCVRPFVGMFMYEPFLPEFFTAITGQSMSQRDFLRTGERAWNMVKVLNVREGFVRKDDSMPERVFDETLHWGPLKGQKDFKLSDYVRSHNINREEWEWLLDGYYDERGWDIERGWPTKARLETLGMKDIASDMVAKGYTLKEQTEPITRPNPWDKLPKVAVWEKKDSKPKDSTKAGG